jgi:hypothetical protein
VFESKKLKIFGSKKEKVTGGLKKLHTEQLGTSYFVYALRTSNQRGYDWLNMLHTFMQNTVYNFGGEV